MALVGLLPKSNEEHVAFAYEKYLDDTARGKKAAKAFKRTFSTTVPIKFVGVWDTVASVGWTFKHLPFTDSNTIIQRFRHALALDEHRVEFMPNLWHLRSRDPEATKHDPEIQAPSIDTSTEYHLPRTVRGWLALPKQSLGSIFIRRPVDFRWDDDPKNDTNDDSEYHHGQATDVQEVWFAGCHADVGGGSTPNHEVHNLANSSLQWMISEVIKNAPYVLFRPDAFTYNSAFSTLTVTETDRDPKLARPRTSSASSRAAAGNPPTSSDPTSLPLVAAAEGYTTLDEADVEEEQTVHSVVQTEPERDANTEMYDQLVKTPMWLILEYMPTIQHYQDENGIWQWRFRCNAQRPREIYDSDPKFHESVKLRKGYDGKWMTKFIPKAGQQVKIEYVK
ncbi:hypothetical protein FRC01_005780 [Tulasnella sp. 417]|nr:hypothetical protein FRC01_005780 [Tulasnella sp. 417]